MAISEALSVAELCSSEKTPLNPVDFAVAGHQGVTYGGIISKEDSSVAGSYTLQGGLSSAEAEGIHALEDASVAEISTSCFARASEMVQVFVTLGVTHVVWNVCRLWSIEVFITKLSGYIARRALTPLTSLDLIHPVRDVLVFKTVNGRQFRPSDRIVDLQSVRPDDNIWVQVGAQVYPLVGGTNKKKKKTSRKATSELLPSTLLRGATQKLEGTQTSWTSILTMVRPWARIHVQCPWHPIREIDR